MLGNAPLVEADMTKCNEYFVAMEAFEMRIDWLTDSKLGKVLRHINVLADGVIPREDDFHFRERSATLATRWAGTFQGTPAPASALAAATAPAPVDVEMAVVLAPAPPVAAPEAVVEAPVVEEKVPEVATNGSAEVVAAVEQPVVANGSAPAAPVVEAAKAVEPQVEEAKTEEVAALALVETVAV